MVGVERKFERKLYEVSTDIKYCQVSVETQRCKRMVRSGERNIWKCFLSKELYCMSSKASKTQFLTEAND